MMDGSEGLPERFALSAISPHFIRQRDAEGTTGMECQPCRSKLTGESVTRTSRGCRIACDGGEEASHITSDGREDQGDSATNTGTLSDSGACAGDGNICSDSSYSYSFTDGNPTQAGGQIAMDSHGLLSLDPQNGAVFHKIINGTFFSLQSTKYTKLFLALSNDNKLSVKGMSKQDMRDESDCHWKFHFFNNICNTCPHDPGDIVLQYYGNRFGPDPERAPYYLVIELTSERVPIFKIAGRRVAQYCGHLGVIPH